MGVLSSTISLTRYSVKGEYDDDSLIERIESGLNKFKIHSIDNEPLDISVGWTSFDEPYLPNFDGSSFLVGNYFIFSLRIDKKSIPAKILTQHCIIEEKKRLEQSGREFLSKNEKSQLKEDVKNLLLLRIPPTPNVFDLIWDYENAELFFYTTQKSANEELESLFLKSFKLTLIKLFPYTMSEFKLNLSDAKKDKIARLTPTIFME